MLQQQVRSPGYLFFEADKKKHFLSGSEAVREAIRKANVDVAISYPITPQSESMHLVGDLFAEGYVKEYFRGENEFAVMSSVAGAAMAGVRVFTATGGPGTMRAFEMFPVWAGSRLPIVCAFLTRGINSPLTIQPDTIEMAFLLETGMLMLHAETAQDLHDMLLKAFIVAEMTDVHLPIGVFADGFFVTHTKEILHIPDADSKLPPYDPHCAPVPAMDMESVPVRQMRDPFVMKSNFISYAAHASWQQEIEAAQERSRKYLERYLGGLLETEHEDAEVLLISSGTAVSQSREAMDLSRKEGLSVGLVKIKSIRPFPSEELRRLAAGKYAVIVPELNRVGWLAKEIKARVDDPRRVIGAPRVFGGMTMPAHLIVDEIRRVLQ
jgi:pyruvate ferredoxin oxidoreductase alpha subunit